METERPSTPPRAVAPTGDIPKIPLTPEQVRKIEINRLKAKAFRDQREAEARNHTVLTANNLAAGQKRTRSAVTPANVPANSRDARSPGGSKSGAYRPLDEIQPAKNYSKFVEYDFSKITDTKGGFLTSEDDPHNKALRVSENAEKPAHMTMKEWERHQKLKQLQKARAAQPSITELGLDKDNASERICRECGNLDIDFKWFEILKCAVCNNCKDKFPEKYSLLTKTEAREDYLLTDPELKDEELLPHLERPNPHKSTWNNMMLYLRYQVEEYALNTKWGSGEKLDEEFERRETEKKKRKEDKFKSKLQELKKRTRVEAYRRSRKGAGGGNFGDDITGSGKHTHVWGRAVDNPETGIPVKTCVECGMEVEELEL